MSQRDKLITTLGLILVPVHTMAAPQAGCPTGESVVFSCLAGKKTASVCLGPASRLQYRFGLVGRKPELIYPETLDAGNDGFQFTANSRSAKGSITNLRFTNAGVSYTIFRFKHASEGNYAGLTVAKPNQAPIRLKCEESSVVDNLWQPVTAALPPIPPSEVIE